MRVLGQWQPFVWLTYAGVAAATAGLVAAVLGSPRLALAALVVAGVADLFDGTVARRFDRTAAQKSFGVLVDTVADVVGFVALPVAVLALVSGWWALVVALAYVLCALARLAHFTGEQADSAARVPTYRGLPVTYAALALPVAALLCTPVPAARAVVLPLVMAVLAVLFVLDVPIPKPGLRASLGLAALAVAALVALAVLPW